MSATVEFKKHYVYVTQEVPQHPNAITKVIWSFEFSDGNRNSIATGITAFDVSDIVSRGAYNELLLADSATDADIEQVVKAELNWSEFVAFHENDLKNKLSPNESKYFGDNTPNLLDPLQVAAVTMRQARLALHQQGLLSVVEDAINLIPEPDHSKIKIEWEYAPTVYRDSPWMSIFASALGLTDQQMDDLFALAATL